MGKGRPGDALLVWYGAGAWLAVALVVGASGALEGARPPMPQVLIALLTLGVVALYWMPTAFRRWVLAVDPRVLVAIHVTRFVGFYFLYLYGRGELPYAFAVPGGIGDIVVAALAIVVCVVTRPDQGRGRGLVLAWNVLGLIDILGVVATATRLGVADPASLGALLRLPLSLLPTFLVPIIIATHLILFARLRRSATRTSR